MSTPSLPSGRRRNGPALFGPGAAALDARQVFGPVMGLVALTLGFCAAGAVIGRNLTHGAGFVCWLAGIACLIGLNVAARRHEGLAITLLFAFGLLLGLAVAPTVAYYAATQPGVVPRAAGATALFVGGLGAVGYAIRRDLSYLYRGLFFALLALIVFGLVAVLTHLPHADLVYSIAGLGVFGLYTVVDFNRLRSAGTRQVVPLAAGIFLDVLNVFLFFLRIFGGRD